MKNKIVLTENMTGFVAHVEALKSKPAWMDRIGLIHGRWGFGKSTALQWFYANNRVYYTRAMAGWLKSVNWMIEDILRVYRVEPRGRLKTDIRELIRVVKKYQAPLFIDEANRLVKRSMLVEMVRDVHDLSRVPIILIGQDDMISHLKRHDFMPFYSRVTEIFEFKPLTVSDIQRIAFELCDLQCFEKVAVFIRSVCLGDFRLVNTLLSNAEEICHLNKLTEITHSVAREAATNMPDLDYVAIPESDHKEEERFTKVA